MMQLAEVLTPEETKTVARFVKTEDGQKALEAKFQVISLKQVLAEGGMFTGTREVADMDFERMRAIYEETMFRRPHWEIDEHVVTRHTRKVKGTVPKLAIAPSRAPNVTYRMTPGFLNFEIGKWSLSVPTKWKGTTNETSFTAVTPIIPVEGRALMEGYKFSLVLWEADWQPVPVPVGDPAILIPLIGDLYAVGYVWDLTELEKEVLRKAFV
jgi:hypothetical protein